jgi:ABC-type sulfate transport system substrate-binding protein
VKQSFFRCFRESDWRRQTLCVLGLVSLVAVTLFGRIMLANSSEPARLVVYGFSSQQEVMTQSILPGFERAWEAETGQKVEVDSLFGPSGTLAGQINLGAPADVVLFSNAQHVDWLKLGKRVRWDTEPVLIGVTPMVIVTRPGNPWAISEYADLAQPGLRLVHADPRTSGAGEWAVLAEYGNASRQSGDPAAAEAQLQAIWRNVRLLGPSARATMTLFELGAGDALVTYEQEAWLALDRGVPLEIVVPPHTIVAQHVAVIVDDNVTMTERRMVQAFVDYLTDAGAKSFSSYYLRPSNLESETLPKLVEPFTVEDLGGWSQAYIKLVETLWQSSIEPRLNLEPAPRLLDAGGG